MSLYEQTGISILLKFQKTVSFNRYSVDKFDFTVKSPIFASEQHSFNFIQSL